MTPWKAKRSLVVMKPIWVTSWQYYNATEARLALSLPGPEPTHKLTLVLSNDVDVELYGPCFVAPLQRAAALADVHMGRPGNGVEYMLKGPFPLQFNYDQYSVENLK